MKTWRKALEKYETNQVAREFSEKRNRQKIIAALEWFGYPLNKEVDVCEDGSVYCGLTQILPKGSV